MAPYIRLAYTKHLSDLILLVGEDAILNLGTIIQFMVLLNPYASQLDDADEIKKNFLTQMPSICNTMKTKPNSYELIKQHIVPALQELLKSNNYDVFIYMKIG
jgi:serine/threonine-protein phosphatase 4 regulatory subunit 1